MCLLPCEIFSKVINQHYDAFVWKTKAYKDKDPRLFTLTHYWNDYIYGFKGHKDLMRCEQASRNIHFTYVGIGVVPIKR